MVKIYIFCEVKIRWENNLAFGQLVFRNYRGKYNVLARKTDITEENSTDTDNEYFVTDNSNSDNSREMSTSNGTAVGKTI